MSYCPPQPHIRHHSTVAELLSPRRLCSGAKRRLRPYLRQDIEPHPPRKRYRRVSKPNAAGPPAIPVFSYGGTRGLINAGMRMRMKSSVVGNSGRFELNGIGLIDGWLEVLEHASKPTFILDLERNSATPIHYNKILRSRDNLRRAVDSRLAVFPNQHSDGFCQWAMADGNELEGYRFAGYSWIGTIVGLRWKVVGGTQDGDGKSFDDALNWGSSNSGNGHSPHSKASIREKVGSPKSNEFGTYSNGAQLILRKPLSPRSWLQNTDQFDWTSPNPVFNNLSQHEQFLHSFDWSFTALGPIATWQADLRRRCVLLTSDCRAAALWYGEKKTVIYNEAYISVIGDRHPAMLGRTLDEAGSTVADDFNHVLEQAGITGKSASVDNELINIQRSGFLEEAYFNWTVIPTRSLEGTIGYYNPIHETTKQVVGERRMQTLLHLGQSMAAVKCISDMWLSVLEGLRPNVYDVPFCLLYRRASDNGESSAYDWALEGALGVQNEQEIESEASVLFTTSRSSAKIQEAFTSGKPTFLHTGDGTLPMGCAEKFKPRGYGDECKSVVIIPIMFGHRVLGFLMLGLNLRRPYDSCYKSFLYIMERMLQTAAASAALSEEEILHGKIVAAQWSEKARDSESRFRKMADTAPVGMFQMSPGGLVQYANDYWYSITEHPKDKSCTRSWRTVVHEKDIPRMDNQWTKLVRDCIPVTFELRLKKEWVTKEMVGTTPVEGATWILMAAYPELHPDQSVKSVIGCVTDISRQKWAEAFQKQRTEQAIDVKVRQEKFIDMTSHELRNPMSAILHCADEISSSLSQFNELPICDARITELVAEMVDAVQTIIHCSEHQKRIIDDILTLSKLESDLLIIAPVDVQPLSVLQTAMKMFEGELHKGDVRMDLVVEESFLKMNLDWARLDPSRLLQIIINLVGNAIKFTRSEQKREIQIIVSASLDRPSDGTYGVDYLPLRRQEEDSAKGPDWGTGRAFYIHVAIKDTGRGLNPKEKELVFQRFVQANPRTQVQYGGSGLGLFISKELTERQGGAIGVKSEVGVGSTFAFFIKARCSGSPRRSQDFLQPINTHDISAAASDSKVVTPVTTSSRIISNNFKLVPKLSLRPSEASRHVLIVEDNLVNQKVLCRHLKNIGCEVHVANHGQEAINFLGKSCFWKSQAEGGTRLSAILMDLEMPVMTGLECVKRIRELQREGTIQGHVPVIAVTANARSEQLLGAKNCGMDSIVTKPFRIPELVPEIERLVASFTALNIAAGSWPLLPA